ncbi:MAG: DUF4983 domain-containing protein [Flavobacteriales bacterium]|nr:DUF4983 domain-containing protein [Flavobacteriales bacterium]
MVRVTFATLFTLLCLVSFGQERKFLLIGIDGLRPDALQAAETPALDALIANSTYSFDALTQFPTYSGPGWSSMLTGVWSPKHGVMDNSFVGSNYADYPHFFSLLKEADPSLYLASVTQWGPINQQILSAEDYAAIPGSMEEAEQEAISQLTNPELDGLMVHLDDVDIAGHEFGYGVDIPEYLLAVEAADDHVSEIISAMQARPDFTNEEWLVAISTDHGGLDFGHGGASYEERNIFIIFSGDNFPDEMISAEYSMLEAETSLALNMNQTNVYGEIDHPVYEFDENEDFTVDLRIKTNGWSDDPAIISDKNWWSGYNPGFVLACQTDQQTWKFNLGDGEERIDLDGGVINDGEWHHILVSCDRDGTTFLWQDGEVVAATVETVSGSIVSDFPIGVGQDGTLSYDFDFDGWIDELRIWNVALDEETIASTTCAAISPSHVYYNDLIGYWKMEEMSDTGIDGIDPNNLVDMILYNGPYVSQEDPMICSILENEIPEIVDIVPTILTHMCVEVADEWDLDGHIWGIDLSGCANEVETVELLSFQIQPNPSNGRFSISGTLSGDLDYEVYHASGKKVLQGRLGDDVRTIELNLAAGVYTIRIAGQNGENLSRQLLIQR